MLKEEIKKNLFKVKKVKINDKEIIGILTPIYLYDLCKFSNEKLKFNTLNSYNHTIPINYEEYKDSIKSVKLSLEEKEITNKIIKEFKEIYKEQKQHCKQQSKYNKMLEDINIKTNALKSSIMESELNHKNKVNDYFNEICDLKGVISCSKFEKMISEFIIAKNYCSPNYKVIIDLFSDMNNVLGFNLIQQWKSKEYVNDHDYDFLTYRVEDEEEYGCDLELEIDVRKIKNNKSEDYNYISSNFININNDFFDDCLIKKENNYLLGDNDVVTFNYITNIIFKESKQFTKETYEYIKSKIDKINTIY